VLLIVFQTFLEIIKELSGCDFFKERGGDGFALGDEQVLVEIVFEMLLDDDAFFLRFEQ
jgi:hypothetical protein